MTKKLFPFFVLLLMFATGCSDDDKPSVIEEYPITVEVKLTNTEVTPGLITLELNNKTSGKSYTFSDLKIGTATEVKVPAGLYNATATARGTLKGVEIDLLGAANDITVAKEKSNTLMITLESAKLGQLVFSEINFSSATEEESGDFYMNGGYVTITNNTSEVQYADGLVFAGAAGDPSWDEPEVFAKHLPAVAIQFAFRVPGSGKEHPIEPGKSITLAMEAQNHNEVAAKAPDLSKADFEWFEPNEEFPFLQLRDNPAVPNMEILFKESESYTMITENMPLLIFRWLGHSAQELIDRMGIMTPYNNPEIAPRKVPYIPSDLIIDGVMITDSDRIGQHVLPTSVDKSSTFVTAMGQGFVVKRKPAADTGRATLQDTNDSREDFLRDQSSSFIK